MLAAARALSTAAESAPQLPEDSALARVVETPLAALRMTSPVSEICEPGVSGIRVGFMLLYPHSCCTLTVARCGGDRVINVLTYAAMLIPPPFRSALESAPLGGWGRPMSDITQLLDRARCGDGAAWEDVVELLYADLKRLARGAIGSAANTMGATGLVHECYERLARAGALGVRDRCHFLSLSARIMRQIVINHARDRIAAKRGGGMAQLYEIEVADNLDEEAEDLLHLDLSLRQLEAVDARLVHVVECRIFAGLSEEETAQAMQVPLRTAQRLWLRARDQLRELLLETA